MTSSELIKTLREQKGISQAELSRLTGVTRACINQIESGKRAAALKTFLRILSVLDDKAYIYVSGGSIPIADL